MHFKGQGDGKRKAYNRCHHSRTQRAIPHVVGPGVTHASLPHYEDAVFVPKQNLQYHVPPGQVVAAAPQIQMLPQTYAAL